MAFCLMPAGWLCNDTLTIGPNQIISGSMNTKIAMVTNRELISRVTCIQCQSLLLCPNFPSLPKNKTLATVKTSRTSQPDEVVGREKLL